MSLKYGKFSLPNEKMQYHLKGSKRRSCDSKRAAVRVPRQDPGMDRCRSYWWWYPGSLSTVRPGVWILVALLAFPGRCVWF